MRAPANGSLLRALRLRAGMKQNHLAELTGVSQSTVSRWERGLLPLSDRELDAVHRRLAKIAGPAADDALKRLIETSALRIHLVCDLTHRLLAASWPRRAEWRTDIADLQGRPLLRFASPEIFAAEAKLAELGWYEKNSATLSVETGPNADSLVPIPVGRFVWERLALADGTAVRLVTTLA